MGLSTCKKAELDTYQLIQVAKIWYAQWRDNKTLRGGPETWKILKMTFHDLFFPRDMWEAKVEEFMNLR